MNGIIAFFRKLLSLLLMPLAMLLSSLSPALAPPPASIAYREEKPAVNTMRTVDEINGVNGSVFYIERPDASQYKTVSAADFGMTPDLPDCAVVMNQCLSYCRKNPGTRLVIPPGVYHFRSRNPLDFNDLHDILIDGTGAEFVFSVIMSQLMLLRCDTVEIRGLALDWDRENDPIDDIVTIQNADKPGKTVELVFPLREDVPADTRLSALTQCDPESLTFGAKGTAAECYIYTDSSNIKGVTKVAGNVLRVAHNGCLNSFENGMTCILRHYVYDGELIHLGGSARNVTFNQMKLYGSTGAAVVCGDKCSHFQILDTVLGVQEKYKALHHVSAGADAIHIVNTCGCFRVEGCDISGQGDDALNVHDGLGYVQSKEGNTIYMYASNMSLSVGDTLRFKDEEYYESDVSAVITESGTEGSLRKITLDDASRVQVGWVAYNTGVNSGNYVIRNNYIHHNRARGFLLQSDNGLCEGNRFEQVEGQAIKVVMDIIPSLWQEGTGVDNLVIRDNTFERCDYSHWGEIITLSTSIDGREASNRIFTNIAITGNTFSGFDTRVFNANNVNGFVFAGNTVHTESPGNRARFGEYCDNVTYEDNTFTGAAAVFASQPQWKSVKDSILCAAGKK